MKKHVMKDHVRSPQAPIITGAVLVLALLGVTLLFRTQKSKHKESRMASPFQLTSPAFRPGGSIPESYTCKGDNISPPLSISGTPENTQSIAIVLHDPDAPGGDFLHWTIWNIHPGITTILEDTAPMGAVQGRNDFGNAEYGGPCPPSGTHHYEFEAFALDSELKLPEGAKREEVMTAVQAHVITQTTLTGTVGAGD